MGAGRQAANPRRFNGQVISITRNVCQVNLLSKRQDFQLRQMQPVIMLGMHRSGTSLLACLLMDVGINMGRLLSMDAEDIYFQRLNHRIFADAGAKWSHVDPILQAMRSQEFVERQTNAMRRALLRDKSLLNRSVSIVGLFGHHLWEAAYQNNSLLWGWKDPRTTITFPIWIRVFPCARCVCVIRNGIDVAISLNRRAKKQQRKWRNRLPGMRQLLPLTYSPITHEFDYCFRLWETYVSFALDHKHLIPSDQYLEVRYEDLLTEPQDQLRRLVDFLDYSVKDDVLFAACEQVDQSRLNNSSYAATYRDEIMALASSPLMRQLGYSYSIAS